MSIPRSTPARLGLCLGLVLALGACNAVNRLATIGTPPPMSPITNPTQQPGYRTVSLPMPDPEEPTHMANSLWRQGARAFFKDQRAARIGDILTVQIAIDDKANFDNATERTRTSTENNGITGLLGYEGSLGRILPQAVNPASLLNLNGNSAQTGEGKIQRNESINVTVAAIITQVLPNGNLVIQGRQEVRVNFEVREFLITGIVRPEDISSSIFIQHTQIAEARISYGGRGQITDYQQPRYGQQVLDVIFPF